MVDVDSARQRKEHRHHMKSVGVFVYVDEIVLLGSEGDGFLLQDVVAGVSQGAHTAHEGSPQIYHPLNPLIRHILIDSK